MQIRSAILIVLFSLGAALLTGCGSNIVYEAGEEDVSDDAILSSSEGSEVKSVEDPADEGEYDSKEEDIIYVYVCGAVKTPGVYSLTPGSRVFEAIEAAGNVNEDAYAQALNLAGILNDADKIYVPTIEEYERGALGQISDKGASGSLSGGAEGKININTADKAALMTLSGIGESKANAIISYREEHGDFKSIEEITNVSGIGKATYANHKDNIIVR